MYMRTNTDGRPCSRFLRGPPPPHHHTSFCLCLFGFSCLSLCVLSCLFLFCLLSCPFVSSVLVLFVVLPVLSVSLVSFCFVCCLVCVSLPLSSFLLVWCGGEAICIALAASIAKCSGETVWDEAISVGRLSVTSSSTPNVLRAAHGVRT